jgi:hypothetical protein
MITRSTICSLYAIAAATATLLTQQKPLGLAGPQWCPGATRSSGVALRQQRRLPLLVLGVHACEGSAEGAQRRSDSSGSASIA